MIQSALDQEKQASTMRNSFSDSPLPEEQSLDSNPSEESYTLTIRDWNFIRKGAHFIHYGPEEVIVKGGEWPQRLYFINSGSVDMVLMPSKPGESSTMLQHFNELEIFGKMSFFDEIHPLITIVSGKEGADLSVIDGTFLNTLFLIEPQIAAKFYKYIALLLASHLRDTQTVKKIFFHKKLIESFSFTWKNMQWKEEFQYHQYYHTKKHILHPQVVS